MAHIWGAAIHILDTLSEGPYSYVELDDYLSRHYGREVITGSLVHLLTQRLIASRQEADGDHVVEEAEQPRQINDFFSISQADRLSTATHFLELSPQGEQVLDLLGIGHP